MITLKEGLKLAIKHKACKGNREAFEKALDQGDTLECYQIALGNKYWLLDCGIIKENDLPELEKLAQGVGKIYNDNGKLYARIHCENGKRHGIVEKWYDNGELWFRGNYKNGDIVL